MTLSLERHERVTDHYRHNHQASRSDAEPSPVKRFFNDNAMAAVTPHRRDIFIASDRLTAIVKSKQIHFW